VVLMGLLITDLGTNVMDILNRSRESVRSNSVPADVWLPDTHL